MSNDVAGPDRSALSDGLGPVGWRYVPSEVWGDQVLTQDPKTAQLARDMGRDVEPLYTEAQMLERVAAERERCARLCEALPIIGRTDQEAFGFSNALDTCAAEIRRA